MIKKRRLDDRHALISTKHYPWRVSRSSKVYAHKVIIGVGGNVGDVLRRFEHLFWVLRRSPYIKIIQSTPILKNPPFGFQYQPDFYNTLIVISTTLTPMKLLKYLLHIEKRFHRRREFKDAPRTLDLDIIFYDDIQITSDRLTIPHPDWMRRDSVLIPLKYLKAR